jgi:hypothetical protein
VDQLVVAVPSRPRVSELQAEREAPPEVRAAQGLVTPDAADLSEIFPDLARLLQRVHTYEGLSTDGVVGGEH